MTTTEMLMVFFGAIGGGIAAASAYYAIMRRMKKWKRDVEPISPIPDSEGMLCTSNRVELMRRVLFAMVVPLGIGIALMILGIAQSELVFLLAAVLFSWLALAMAVVWVFLRRKYGDSIRYTDAAFTMICMRAEPRRQTHPWNHLRGITVVDDTHIRLDFKNGTAITLAYLTDTDDLIQTARSQISV